MLLEFFLDSFLIRHNLNFFYVNKFVEEIINKLKKASTHLSIMFIFSSISDVLPELTQKCYQHIFWTHSWSGTLSTLWREHFCIEKTIKKQTFAYRVNFHFHKWYVAWTQRNILPFQLDLGEGLLTMIICNDYCNH